MKLLALIRRLRRHRSAPTGGTPRRDLPPAGNIADANTTLRSR
jgi:hypothetical protein